MKKILLTLGSIVTSTVPVVFVISCAEIGKTKKPPINAIIQPATSEYDKIRLSLQDFSSGNGHSTKTVTENPFIQSYLSDVTNALRTFQVYDNGLFKIKIEEALIGHGRPFSSKSKALLLAKDIAYQINIGPAINDLPKGIQILNSTKPASLGGQAGVQVALNAASGIEFSDRDILATTSLVAHEYGHHESMWDLQYIVNGSKEVKVKRFIKELADDGYISMARVATNVLGKPRTNIEFAKGSNSLYPSAYSDHPKYQPSVFIDKIYPFGFEELVTRIQNILSFRMSKKDTYEYRTIPAFLTSDMTFRHFAQDSLFGTGKDNTRVDKLYKGLLKDVFGVGSESISIKYDYNNKTLNGITYNSFGVNKSLDSIQIFKNGVLLKKINLNVTKGLFGHKSELFSNIQTTKEVYNILSTPIVPNMGIVMPTSDEFTIKGFKGTTEVNISNINLNNATTAGGTWGDSYLTIEGNHLKIS